MRLLQIQSGVSINVDKIDGIKEVDENTCEVYVGKRTYIATYPYDTLMSLLRQDEIVDQGKSKEQVMDETLKTLKAVKESAQFFAG